MSVPSSALEAVLVPSEFLAASRQAGFPRMARAKLCPSLRPVCPEHGVLQVLWGVGVVPLVCGLQRWWVPRGMVVMFRQNIWVNFCLVFVNRAQFSRTALQDLNHEVTAFCMQKVQPSGWK